MIYTDESTAKAVTASSVDSFRDEVIMAQGKRKKRFKDFDSSNFFSNYTPLKIKQTFAEGFCRFVIQCSEFDVDKFCFSSP